MLDYVAPTHGILTLVLMAIYLYLAIRFFLSKTEEASFLDRFFVQFARYSLLLVFISGLLMYMSMGKFVSTTHQLISIIPAILVVGTKYLPILTRKPNTLRTYAWVFSLLFILMIILGITARYMKMPQF